MSERPEKRLYQPIPIKEEYKHLFPTYNGTSPEGMTIFDDSVQGPRYLVGKPFGKGGLSHVYHCWDEKEGVIRACKIAIAKPDDGEFSPHNLQPIEAQIQKMHSTVSSHVPQVYGTFALDYDYFKESPTTATIMELLPQESYQTLFEHISNGLNVQDVAEIILQSSEAIDTIHQNGDSVHLDVKPGNFLYSKSEKKLFLIDFGVAAMLQVLQNHPELKLTLGTMLYISPEAVQGEAVDKKRDLWAHAIMCFELLTGVKPFNLDKIEEEFKDDEIEKTRAIMTAILESDGLNQEDRGILYNALDALGIYDLEDQELIAHQFNSAFLNDSENRFETATTLAQPIAQVLQR